MKECPRCHKKFNNNIKFCPVCGYEDNDMCNNVEKTYDNEFKTCPKCRKQYMYLIDHCFECGYSTQAYKNRMKKLEEDIEKPIVKQPSSQVHCPYCNSTNVNKISSTKKAMSIIDFGILSNKIGKQWHCNNCKSDF